MPVDDRRSVLVDEPNLDAGSGCPTNPGRRSPSRGLESAIPISVMP
jgi:hypothetical protein